MPVFEIGKQCTGQLTSMAKLLIEWIERSEWRSLEGQEFAM